MQAFQVYQEATAKQKALLQVISVVLSWEDRRRESPPLTSFSGTQKGPLLCPITPHTGQIQFAPSNCIIPGFSTLAGDLGVQAAYSRGIFPEHTQLFTEPGAELMLFHSSSSKLAIPLDSGFGVTDFVRSPDFLAQLLECFGKQNILLTVS